MASATAFWRATQGLWEPRFTYTHGIAFAVILFLWNLQRTFAIEGSSSSGKSDPSNRSSSAFLPPRPLRPRAGSGDTEAESVLTEDVEFHLHDAKDVALEKQVPEATPAERLRFLTAKQGNLAVATAKLQAYLAWVNEHSIQPGEPGLLELELYTDDMDCNDWNIAAAAAIKARNETCHECLPRIARLHQIDGTDVCDNQGHRVLHIIPGQMNDGLVSLGTYALAVALYIDRKLNRASSEKVSVVIDVRGGVGWRNLHAAKLLPFIQATTMLLLTMFPERLSRAVVYPLPPAFGWIWKISKRYIDPLTAEKICIVTGVAKIVSLPPNAKLIKYMEQEVVELLEKQRVAAFITALTQ